MPSTIIQVDENITYKRFRRFKWYKKDQMKIGELPFASLLSHCPFSAVTENSSVLLALLCIFIYIFACKETYPDSFLVLLSFSCF